MNLIVMNWAGSSLTCYLQKSDVVTLQGACEQVIRSKNSKDRAAQGDKAEGKIQICHNFFIFCIKLWCFYLQ